jgi:hypothetical protein
MEVGTEFQARIDSWGGLSQWERSELGKDLRRLGLSYGEIMDLIPVKKSTLATWCREVRLTVQQYVAIRTRTGSREGVPRDTNRKRRIEISLVRLDALSQTPDLMTDPLWVAGIVLYWAEGAKTRNHLKMANADPRALRVFIRWVRHIWTPMPTSASNSISTREAMKPKRGHFGVPRPVWRLPTSTRLSSNRKHRAPEEPSPTWRLHGQGAAVLGRLATNNGLDRGGGRPSEPSRLPVLTSGAGR